MATILELLENLKVRHAKLKEQLLAIERAIRGLEQAARVLREQNIELNEKDVLAAMGLEPDSGSGGGQRRRGALSPDEVARHVRALLTDVGRPMKRGEIVSELQKRKIPVGGQNVNKNLGTILWRHRREFVSLKGLGYWLADTPLEGIYEPS